MEMEHIIAIYSQ